MKKLLIFSLLILIISSCNNTHELKLKQEWYDSNKTQIKKEYYAIKSKSHNFVQGVYKEYNKSGNIDLEGHYLLGQKHGKFIKYDEKGSKITEQLFKYNKLDSISVDYYPNGQVKMKSSYINDTLNGPMIEYFDNGKPSKYINIKNGIKQGESKLFYPSGSIKAVMIYNNGKLNGPLQIYDSLGKIIINEPMKEGKYFKESSANK